MFLFFYSSFEYCYYCWLFFFLFIFYFISLLFSIHVQLIFHFGVVVVVALLYYDFSLTNILLFCVVIFRFLLSFFTIFSFIFFFSLFNNKQWKQHQHQHQYHLSSVLKALRKFVHIDFIQHSTIEYDDGDDNDEVIY